MIRTTILITQEEAEYLEKQGINLSNMVRNVIDFIMENQIPLETLLKKMCEGDKNRKPKKLD